MAERITVISSMATKRILADLIGHYERQSAFTVEVQSMGGVDAARKVRDGTDADLIILASDVLEKLEAEGHIVAGSRRDFARSGMAVAVRSGSPRPAIEDEASVKQAILDSRKFCFSTGPSGDHLKRLFDRWGSPK